MDGRKMVESHKRLGEQMAQQPVSSGSGAAKKSTISPLNLQILADLHTWSLEDVGKEKLVKGKHAGKTLASMMIEDSKYLYWILTHTVYGQTDWLAAWVFADKLNNSMADALGLDQKARAELGNPVTGMVKKEPRTSSGGSSGSGGGSRGGGGAPSVSTDEFMSRLVALEEDVKKLKKKDADTES